MDPAGFWLRLHALAVDCLIVFAAFAIVILVVAAVWQAAYYFEGK